MSLPIGYKQLEYIQSDGTQYIDTGFVPTANTRVVMDFQLTKAGKDNLCLFGVVGQFSFRWYGSSSVFRSNGSNGVNFPTGIDGTARHTVDKTATTCKLDDTYSVTNTAATISEPLYLFAQHTGGGSYTNYVSAKLYSCKIYENGSLVRDFVPCKNSSATVGLYDVVNSKFYGNPAYTSVFIAGNVATGTGYEIITSGGFSIQQGITEEGGSPSNCPSNYAYITFEMSDEISLDGNTMSLVDPTTLTIVAYSTSEAQSKLPAVGTYIKFKNAFYQITESTYAEWSAKHSHIDDNYQYGSQWTKTITIYGLDKQIVIDAKPSHNALIDSTCYSVVWGKTLINGTEYDIVGGKTLVDGTVYTLTFNKNFTVQILTNGNGAYGYMTIKGTGYSKPTTVECASGTTLSFYASSNTLRTDAEYVTITLNGEVVARAEYVSGWNGYSNPATFSFVPDDRSIVSVSFVKATDNTTYRIDIVTS
jgi:hypothetical protein